MAKLAKTTSPKSKVFYTNSLGTFELYAGKLKDSKGKKVSSKQLRDEGGPLLKSDAKGKILAKERGILKVEPKS